jgi:hypothetical protein
MSDRPNGSLLHRWRISSEATAYLVATCSTGCSDRTPRVRKLRSPQGAARTVHGCMFWRRLPRGRILSASPVGNRVKISLIPGIGLGLLLILATILSEILPPLLVRRAYMAAVDTLGRSPTKYIDRKEDLALLLYSPMFLPMRPGQHGSGDGARSLTARNSRRDTRLNGSKPPAGMTAMILHSTLYSLGAVRV